MNNGKLKMISFIIIFFFTFLNSNGKEKTQNIKKDRIDFKTKVVVIKSISKLLIEQYIFLDTAQKMKAYLNKRLGSGVYDKINDPSRFAEVVREDLYAISKDNHFHIEFNPQRARIIKTQKSQSKEEKKKAYEFELENDRLNSFGFKKLEHLRGNIGYLNITRFCHAEYAGETAVASMKYLSNADAVIIDLRDNSGGQATMVQLLLSYFIKGTQEGRTHYNSFMRRYNSSIEQFWTISYVPGKRMYDMDLYILTDKNTGSAAEEFSYALKNLRRATIVGETTRGSAHPIVYKIIENDFIFHLPDGQPINPISKTNWEKVGIKPHVVVPGKQALNKAYLIALEKILKQPKNDNQKFQVKWAIEDLRAKLNPIVVDREILKKYAGKYNDRVVNYDKKKLYYQRKGSKFKLIPLRINLFAVEGFDYFRIKFIMDKKGKVTEIISLYDDGSRYSQKRDDNK